MAQRHDHATLTTGTTTVGIAVEDGVVLAADRRMSLGGRFVASKDAVKIEQVHPTAALTIAGTVGPAQDVVRRLRAHSRLYDLERDGPPSIDALATVAGAIVRGVPMSSLLAGVDESGPTLYQVDGGGGVLADAYAATGSGLQPAYGVFERAYDPDASLAAARAVATDAVAAASERDTASGNGATVATVTADGVAIEDSAEVA